MRNAGSKGVVEAVRAGLLRVSLENFGTSYAAAFRDALNSATDQITRGLPRNARHWGFARKGINIFLRDCLYTVYLREAYSLHLSERFYEVPLDSITGKQLAARSDGRLPRWHSVRAMNRALSDKYQNEAARLADLENIARVHLDAVWWGERAEDEVREAKR